MTDPVVPADGVPSKLDLTVPQSARVWNYLLGGKDNFEVDRQAAEGYKAMFPPIVAIARADRAFLGRSVRFLAGEAGIRQFLDIGTGLPTMDNTHQVAQRVAPDSRIVYVDNDPMVLVHANALLTSTREGACAYIDADLQNPQQILAQATATLDFMEPVAVMLLGILHFIPDLQEATHVVRQVMDAIPAGSYLVLTHATLDFDEDSKAQAEAQDEWRDRGASPMTPRGHAELLAFFDGLELEQPGVVSMSRWRPDLVSADGGLPAEVPGYGGVARKP